MSSTCPSGHPRTPENVYLPPGRVTQACRICNREAARRYKARKGKPPKPRPTLEERFWSKVDKGSGCWEWTGALSATGYGLFSYEGKSTGAHVVALILSGSERLKGMDACHRCDNPPCVNPRHLYFGTRAENMADAYARGRRAPGEGHAAARLSEAQVVEIRNAYARGALATELGGQYGVHKSTIYGITTGRKWPNAAGPITRRKASA